MEKGGKIVGFTMIIFGLFMAGMILLVFALAGLGGGFYAVPIGVFLFFGSFGLLCIYIMGGKDSIDQKIEEVKERKGERNDARESEKNAGKCEYCGRPIGHDNPLHCPWCGAKLW